MPHLMSVRRFSLVWAPLLALTGCGDASPSVRSAPVSVSFVTVAGAPVSQGLPGTTAFAGSLTVEGTNGTLVLEELHLLVDRVHLVTPAGTCREALGDSAVDAGDVGDAGSRCPPLGAGPFLVDLPMDAVPVKAVEGFLTPARYTGLRIGTAGPGRTGRARADTGTPSPLARIRDAFPGWPDEAAIRVAGSFAPADGTAPRPFVTYLRAEEPVSLELVPPVKLAAGDSPQGLLVTVDPRAWFPPVGGVVPDLSSGELSPAGPIPDLGVRTGDAFIRAGLDD